jgi:hypothetical protein
MSTSALATGMAAVNARANRMAATVLLSMVMFRLLRIAGIASRDIHISGGDRSDRGKGEGKEQSENSFFDHWFRFLSLLGISGVAGRDIDIGGGDRSDGGQGKGKEQSENGFFHHWFKVPCFCNDCERKARVTASGAKWGAT